MIAAVVAAAGRAERMGRPKLTLPLGGLAVIARVIGALRGGGADPVVVVGPPSDFEGSADLVRSATEAGAVLIQPPGPTADMRGSIELGLGRLDRDPHPEAVLILPGDSPGLTAALVARVIAGGRSSPGSIVVPAHAGKRGHPLLLPWSQALAIRGLPLGVGVNALLAEHQDGTIVLDVEESGAVGDLDTPDDYRRWAARFGD